MSKLHRSDCACPVKRSSRRYFWWFSALTVLGVKVGAVIYFQEELRKILAANPSVIVETTKDISSPGVSVTRHEITLQTTNHYVDEKIENEPAAGNISKCDQTTQETECLEKRN